MKISTIPKLLTNRDTVTVLHDYFWLQNATSITELNRETYNNKCRIQNVMIGFLKYSNI